MLRITSLDTSYGAVRALHNVSLSVEAGSITFVVGPNGAGKSTLLLTIAGVLSPSSGRISFSGTDVTGRAAEELARDGLSLVPEGRQIFSSLTVAENLRLGLMIGRRRSAGADVDRVLNYFPILAERYRQAAGTLSGGEQQQLAIARALLTKPRFLMIDQPSLGLAPLIVDDVYRVLQQLRDEGMTMLIVEQRTSRIADFGDHIYVLREGSVVFDRAIEALQNQQELEDAYFGYSSAD